MEKSIKEDNPIKKRSSVQKKTSISTFSKLDNDVEWIINAIDAAGLQEFMDYIRSPWKMFLSNFIAGIARWFGALVGAAIVIALVWWLLSTLIDLPLIWKKIEPYVDKIQVEFRKYTEATNYRDNFERMESTLESIDRSLKK